MKIPALLFAVAGLIWMIAAFNKPKNGTEIAIGCMWITLNIALLATGTSTKSNKPADESDKPPAG